ncbi:MAG: glycosyltransferase [Bacteroidaceae bacterium]|nr:glycosyltransferase [Bacteroidaceae bacterium]
MKLSVIVPVYNVENFLPRCLDSLLRQGMGVGEYEVICVNDGSPDNSAAILADYEKQHPDIFRVITQENQGLGGARNTGTAQAQGEYVTYLDSDDYIIDNAYSYLLEHFCGDKPDVLCYGYACIYTDGKTRQHSQATPDGEVTFDGDGVDAYNRWPLTFVWSKFYKRSFIQQHQIESHIVSCQDEVFNFDVFRHHPHTRIVSSNVCRYELGNENSIQRTVNKQKVLKTLDDMFLNIDYVRGFLAAGQKEIEPAAMRSINNFQNVYHKKLIMVFLSWKEWHAFRKKMQGLPAYKPVPTSESRSARWLGNVKKWSGSSYLFYIVVCFIRNVIFFKLIRPLMLRKQTAE